MTPWARYGSANRMILLNRKVFNRAHHYLKEQLKNIIDIYPVPDDDSMHRYDTATITNGDTNVMQECLTLPVKQNDFVTEEQQAKIKSTFPFNIGNLYFEFATVFDYDFDEDREWQPKIAFTVKETSLEQTRDDQIFVYWDQ